MRLLLQAEDRHPGLAQLIGRRRAGRSHAVYDHVIALGVRQGVREMRGLLPEIPANTVPVKETGQQRERVGVEHDTDHHEQHAADG